MELRRQLMREIETLPEQTLLAISVLIKERRVSHTSVDKVTLKRKEAAEKRLATLGAGKGKMWISDDFDAPLEELKEYME